MPTIDQNIKKAYELTYEGRELDAALQSITEYPTFKEDCKAKKAIKERLRMEYMKLLLKKAA